MILAAMAFTQANAQQKKETPVTPGNEAKAAFNQKFPGATKARWEKEGADLEVNFEMNGHEMSAVFSPKGQWQETETEIPVKALPANASRYLQEHFAGQKVSEAARIEKADGSVRYEAEVGKKDILFDASGKWLK